MSALDVAKEKIAYLKFWLGVMVVADISMAGWLITSAESAPSLKAWAGIIAVVVVTFAGYNVHRQIERRIDALKEL